MQLFSTRSIQTIHTRDSHVLSHMGVYWAFLSFLASSSPSPHNYEMLTITLQKQNNI